MLLLKIIWNHPKHSKIYHICSFQTFPPKFSQVRPTSPPFTARPQQFRLRLGQRGEEHRGPKDFGPDGFRLQEPHGPRRQLATPFKWCDAPCHPCIITTHLSYSFLSLKLPPQPCAVLLVSKLAMGFSPIVSFRNAEIRRFGALCGWIAIYRSIFSCLIWSYLIYLLILWSWLGTILGSHYLTIAGKWLGIPIIYHPSYMIWG